MIDFTALAQRLLSDAERHVSAWLPNGRKQGQEWCTGDLTGAPGDSCKVNLVTGRWSDFATGEAGGDLISLYAAINRIDQGKAARELGGEDVAAPSAPKKPARSEWTPIVPAPAGAPAFRLSHHHYGAPSATWEYRGRAGDLLGYVCRFDRAGGGKEILPACWAKNNAGEHAWRWLSFPKPRPLFNLPALANSRPVLVVEGEKCAMAAAAAFPDYAVLSWPGGSKAVKHADWRALEGRHVTIWPDLDQEGEAAAAEIVVRLQGVARELRVIDLDFWRDMPKGWDVADALAMDMPRSTWHALIAAAPAALSPAESPAKKKTLRAAEGVSTPAAARAEDPDSITWADGLTWVYGAAGALRDCRENVIHYVNNHPAWSGVLVADEFARQIICAKPSPLGHKPGAPWTENDDAELALWLSQRDYEMRMLVRSLSTVAEAVRLVANRHRVHPLRDWINRLRGTWDRVERVDRWAVDFLGCKDSDYTRLVGRYFLLNMVRRALHSGGVMRSVPVLEGPQNRGKSTALRQLAEPWFADTVFRVGDKDAYLLIQGVWLYEIAELESFSRAEATAVKAFVSSPEDTFRAPYDRDVKKHPRVTCFAATTNAREWAKDWTGNTRYWPLRTSEADDIKPDGIAAMREQLFAEALSMVEAGERAYPDRPTEERLFVPEQEARLVSHPWIDLVGGWLASHTRSTVTVREVMEDALGFRDWSKVNPQGGEAQRVGQILAALHWEKRRPAVATGARGWVWSRPAERTTASLPGTGATTTEHADEVPF